MPETKYNKNQNTNPYYNRLIHQFDDTNKIKSKYDKKITSFSFRRCR